MADVRIAVSPTLDRAVRRLRLYGKKLSSWPVLFVEIGEAFAEAEREWFQTQGDGSWKPLSKAYAERKAKLYPGKTILVASGELEKSLTDTLRAIRLIPPDMFTFGSDVEVNGYSLAELHQSGTERMPVRKPIISIRKQREIARTLTLRHVKYGPNV
jgi:hypothetical protein